MVDAPSSRIAVSLRALRVQRDLTIVELAKRSGVARATLTKLEAGQGNPTVDTLYALADSLGVALGDLIGEAGTAARVEVVRAGEGPQISGAVSARLLDRVHGHGLAEVYEIFFTTRRRAADPHPSGVLESIFLVEGRLRVGPVAEPVELSAGDFVRFAGDVPHFYQSIGGPARGVLVMSHP